VKVSCSTAGMAEYLKRIKTLVSLSLLLPKKCRTWSMYEYVAKKKFQKTSREKMKTREIITRKAEENKRKLFLRKSDENKRKLFPENPLRTGENKRKLFKENPMKTGEIILRKADENKRKLF
jgi:hypothetical protein